jgi:hypothetical protein
VHRAQNKEVVATQKHDVAIPISNPAIEHNIRCIEQRTKMVGDRAVETEFLIWN